MTVGARLLLQLPTLPKRKRPPRCSGWPSRQRLGVPASARLLGGPDLLPAEGDVPPGVALLQVLGVVAAELAGDEDGPHLQVPQLLHAGGERGDRLPALISEPGGDPVGVLGPLDEL